MSLIIFPKAFNVGFFQKESPPSGQDESASTLVEAHPVVSEVSPVPNPIQRARSIVGQRIENTVAPFMDEEISVQYQ